MRLTFGQPVVLLILSAVLAAGLTYWLYRSSIPALGSGKKWLLATIRWSALSLILFLLGEPLFRQIEDRIIPPVVAVLADESQSMTLAEERSQWGIDADLTTVTAAIEDAINGVEVRRFAFGEKTHPQNPLDSLSFSSSRTDIGQALEYLRTTLTDVNFGAVVLLSDGRNNVGKSPQRVAESFPVPIITVTLGDTTVRKDIRIQRIQTNDISYVGSEVPIRVRIRNEGFESTPVSVTLAQADKRLQSKQIRLPDRGREIEVELLVTPDEAGLYQYSVSLSRLAGEATFRNNREVFSLQVLDRKRRVLLLASGPSPDVAAIRDLLESDPDTEVLILVERKNGTFYEGRITPDILSDIDLALLIGYPGATSPAGTLELLASRLDAGLPMLFFLGRGIDLQKTGRYLGKYLPATPEIIRTRFGSGSFTPSKRALDHAIFEIPDRRDASVWQKLPPLDINETRFSVRPDAEVLATTKVRGIQLVDPMLVISRRTSSRSAMWLASGFWKWSNVPEDLSSASSAWKRVFSNLVQWIITAGDDRPVRVYPERTRMSDGSSVIFEGQVYDESARPVSDASVDLRLKNPAGEIFPYTLRPTGNGIYRLDLGTLPEGTYSYSAEARRENRILGTDSGTFSVGALAIEFRNPHSDAITMRQIASRSGGASVAEDKINSLEELLSAMSSIAPIHESVEVQTKLWRKYAFLLAIVSLLTLEWFLRKRFGLV
jgi:hypothetical protein